ncbi:MAG TPA: lysophospholipid acyltransferase family protein [Ktedonobacterales bacterium]
MRATGVTPTGASPAGREPAGREPEVPRARTHARAGAWRGRALAWGSRLVVLVGAALRRLPPRVRYLPADAITAVVARVWGRGAVVERNFARVLGVPPRDPRARTLARRSLRNFGRMAIDFLASTAMSDAEVWRWVTPVGESMLAEALAPGHGVIFAMPHIGSWDVCGAYAAAYGFKVTVVIDNHLLAQLVSGARRYRAGGVTLAPRDRSLRMLYQALARNEGIVLLSDVAEGAGPTLAVPFFGRPARFPVGAARLALRTGAPIVVLACVRMPDGRYRIEGQPPIWPDRAQSQDEAVRGLTAAMAAGYERVITRYPEHWYPFHAIWED